MVKTAFLNTLKVLSYVLLKTPFTPDGNFSHSECFKIACQNGYILKIAVKRPKIVKDCLKYRPNMADDIQKSRLELIKKMGLI